MKRPVFVICYLSFVISVVSIAGHAQSPVGVQEPAWSADGKRIAVSYLDRIWTMTADGKQARAVVQDLRTSHLRQGSGGQARPQDHSEYLVEREPAWSPDGTKLAFAVDRGKGFDIVVAPMRNGAAAGAPIAVTSTAGDERWPSWTADGRIVFAHREAKGEGRRADPGLQWDLFVTSPGAAPDAWQAPLALTTTDDSETYPRVSPDGTKVALINRETGFSIMEHRLELKGICADCSERIETKK